MNTRRFDLDRAIRLWRTRLEQRRTFSVDDIDELESHLREDIDRMTANGRGDDEAFRCAESRLGRIDEVEPEYRKTRWAKSAHRQTRMADIAAEAGMIAGYARIAMRELLRNKVYAVVNIGGLALGIAASLAILTFVLFETSFDRHHENADRIYRVTREWFDEKSEPVLKLARISVPIAPAMEAELPEVERAVRLWQVFPTVSREARQFREPNAFLVDSTYFDVFDVDIVAGQSDNPLARPGTALITQDVATRYFDDADPIGQTLTLYGSVDVEIVGVVSPAPPNAHFHPELLISFATGLDWISEDQMAAWGMFNNFATYILLADGADPVQLEEKLEPFLRTRYTPENNSRDVLRLQALTDIHLHSELDAEIEPNGNATYVYLLLAVAGFVLLTACFNFINLATARSMYRSREVGVRKVLGAQPGQVARQFLGESSAFALVSTVLAVALVIGSLPTIGEIAGRDLSLSTIDPLAGLGLVITIVAMVGLAAGAYPAMVLSRFQPIDVLKSGPAGRWRSRLRSGLIVTQFAIAAILISGMSLVFRQVEYMQDRNLGFNKEHLVVLTSSESMRTNFGDFRSRLASSGHVSDVTASRLVPSGALVDHIGVRADVSGRMVESALPLNPVDHRFAETYGIEMVAGRTFDPALASDSNQAVILNESAVRSLGWPTPEAAVDSRFVLDGNNLQAEATVIGVVEDFHFESVRDRIAPLVMFIMPQAYRNVTVRIRGNDIEEELAYLEEIWTEYRPNAPFEFRFVDQSFAALYDSERQLGSLFAIFGGLAIIIACLGLFGLASFVTERRSKEIGIRKSLGASAASIVRTLTSGFLKHVGVALALALPAAYFLSRWWLDSFAYGVGFGLDAYGLMALAVAALALLTVAGHALRAAVADPVVSLRDE